MTSDVRTPSTPTPSATAFERRLDAEIEEVYGKGSGTVWNEAAKIVAEELGLSRKKIGLISTTTVNVVNNRPLSAGLVNQAPELLIIAVGDEVGLDRQEAAIVDLMPKTRHLTTVALAGRADSGDGTGTTMWRVQRLIEVHGHGIADQVRPSFPLVEAVRVEPFVPLDDVAPHALRHWLVESERLRSNERVITVSRDTVIGSDASVGDGVLLCDPDFTYAHSAARVASISDVGDHVDLLLDPYKEFPEPVPL